MGKRFFFCIIIISVYLKPVAQNVGIGTATPNMNAALDISSNSRGLLIPRTSTAARLAIPAVKGLMLYDTTTSSFWFNNGSNWIELSSGAASGAGWLLTGNTGTNPAANFIGTADNQPLLFKINNTTSGILSNTNSFYGKSAGITISTGFGNTGIGVGSLENTSTGYTNTAAGAASLQTNTAGYANAAFGNAALQANTSGYLNTAIGATAMISNTAGIRNAALGYGALGSNENGNDNAASGMYALYNNISGSFNTANGFYALYSNSSGSYNTAIGQASLQNTAGAGSYNTAVGANTLLTNGGSNITALGYNADVANGTVTANATAIGNGAVVGVNNRMRLGNVLLTSVESWGSFNSLSDARFKKDVQENVKGLDFILKLRPVTYSIDSKKYVLFETAQMPETVRKKRREEFEKENLNSSKPKVRTGFLAQEVAEAARQAGFDFDGVNIPDNEDSQSYSIAYGNFTVPLVKAVQEQQKIIEDLIHKNEKLESELKLLKTKLGL